MLEQLKDIKNQNNLYKKEHKTFEEQLELLKQKGLIVFNEEYALTKLKHINYYRLLFKKQSQYLTKLRDLLLPMLMNGQVSVK